MSILHLLKIVFGNFLPEIFAFRAKFPWPKLFVRFSQPRCALVVILYLSAFIIRPIEAFGEEYGSEKNDRYYYADINVTYIDMSGVIHHFASEEIGKYSDTARISPASGTLVHVQHHSGNKLLHTGCQIHDGLVPSTRWIALVKRGNCTFKQKIQIAAVSLNASAVLVYDNSSASGVITMNDEAQDVISVFLPLDFGQKLARLADNGTKVTVSISVGRAHATSFNNISKTSVLFVSISFIVLMIISLAWLVFYYIQRFRYAHAKERLSRRLSNAAKKALTKIPQRTLKNGDKETRADFDQCAICIEGYKVHDVVRILPCKHLYHKSCVDPWLLEQRSCPMCKMDILKAYGFLNMSGSQESVTGADLSQIGGHGEALELVVDLASARPDVRAARVSPRSQDSSSDHEHEDSGESVELHHVQVLHLQPPDIETHDRERSTRRLNTLGTSVVVDEAVDTIEADADSTGAEITERQSLMSSQDRLNATSKA